MVPSWAVAALSQEPASLRHLRAVGDTIPVTDEWMDVP